MENRVKTVVLAYNDPFLPYIDPSYPYIDPSVPYNGSTNFVHRSESGP